MRVKIINTHQARNRHVIGKIITVELINEGIYRFEEDLGTRNQRILASNIKLLSTKNIIGGKLI